MESQRIADHLANERTFLAWTRTSLSLIGIGFVVARFGLALGQWLKLEGRPLTGHTGSIEFGAGLMVAGVLMEIGATVRYERTRTRIISGQFESAHWMTLVVGVLTALVGLALAFDMLMFRRD